MHGTFLNTSKDTLQELQEAFPFKLTTLIYSVDCLGLHVQFCHEIKLKDKSKPPP